MKDSSKDQIILANTDHDSSDESSGLEINFAKKSKVELTAVEAESPIRSSLYDKIVHPTLTTPQVQTRSEPTSSKTSNLHLAQKAKGYSRYFLPRSNSSQVLHMEEPYYYFHNSSSKIPSVIFSHEKCSDSTLQTSSTELKVEDISKTIELRDFIMSAEEIKYIDQEFDEPPNPFKRKLDYINPVIYYKNYKFGQFLAVLLLLIVVIFGSIGFLINTARIAYTPIPPEVYEILSPYKYPTLSAIRTSLVDPDTPQEFHYRNSTVTEGEVWKLVFSDEFNADDRTFFEGDDQFFTAVDLHYAATNDLEYYLPFMARTKNGSLQLTMEAYKYKGMDYISAMIQSWNKLCFNKNAIVEVSLRMPSYAQSRGLWPAVWSLGNLARPGYMATTYGLWPYTYNECDYGITPNQSSPDGISYLPGQRLSKCTCYGQDHPNIGTGRGAPEIDIIEGTRGLYDDWALGAQTLQVAPFDNWWRPDYDYLSIENLNITSMKPDTGTPSQEAIASTTVLNNAWFENLRNATDLKSSIPGQTHFQKYGFEYKSLKTADRDSYIQFFVADQKTLGIRGDALHPTESVGWRDISKEPMSLIFNLGLSPTWMNIDFGSLEYPATFEIDYVRIYQPEGEEEMTCNPPDYPTTDYINKHVNAYSNANLTSWENAGYKYPSNSFMHGCQGPTI